jgi:hypothetical protein
LDGSRCQYELLLLGVGRPAWPSLRVMIVMADEQCLRQLLHDAERTADNTFAMVWLSSRLSRCGFCRLHLHHPLSGWWMLSASCRPSLAPDLPRTVALKLTGAATGYLLHEQAVNTTRHGTFQHFGIVVLLYLQVVAFIPFPHNTHEQTDRVANPTAKIQAIPSSLDECMLAHASTVHIPHIAPIPPQACCWVRATVALPGSYMIVPLRCINTVHKLFKHPSSQYRYPQ